MANKKRNPKTDLIAYAIFAVIIISLALVFTGKASLTEVGEFAAILLPLLTAIGFKLSADAKGQQPTE